jgi:hypothetical protein
MPSVDKVAYPAGQPKCFDPFSHPALKYLSHNGRVHRDPKQIDLIILKGEYNEIFDLWFLS